MSAVARWRVANRDLSTVDHTLLMGILNVTPDSFSDGGRHVDAATAIDAGLRLVADGADIVDVGGESTRPGAHTVDVDTEIDRVLPVVRTLAEEGVVVSIDTRRAPVAQVAIDAGAVIVNDVSGLSDPAMPTVCAAGNVGVVIMHMQGTPSTMQEAPRYDDVVADIKDHLLERVAIAEAAGISSDRVCIDPGIGFGKTLDHNLTILANLDAFVALGYPVMVGTSRKGFLGAITERNGWPTEPHERDAATAATTALGIAAGVAVVRSHDMPSTMQAARTADAIVRAVLGEGHGGTWRG